ncbi:hypothetical protein E2C01_071728 [Portunus trituberculatus]|uniref:Uncharacterized protein n=1 Tax=Portunus trituberculatus TaxID=210409 RepID=A0A5B7I6Z4_PORTR|nr:hypothetical protein [Portunus trituberculatus]
MSQPPLPFPLRSLPSASTPNTPYPHYSIYVQPLPAQASPQSFNLLSLSTSPLPFSALPLPSFTPQIMCWNTGPSEPPSSRGRRCEELKMEPRIISGGVSFVWRRGSWGLVIRAH